jgi:beta-glucosidase
MPIPSCSATDAAELGPTGVTNGQGVSGWVGPQTLAGSWNKSLVADQYGRMAVEFRKKGFNMLLGPSSGPLGRSPLGSRLWEGLVRCAMLSDHILIFC